MTPNQRRPGFRLPWSSEGAMGEDGSTDAEGQSGAPSTEATDHAVEAPKTEHDSNAAPEAPGEPAAADATDEMGEHAAAASANAADDDAPLASERSSSPSGTAPPASPPVSSSSQPAEAGPPATGFLGDLVAAMRRVADEARETTLADLRSRIDAGIHEREDQAERRKAELRAQAETDVAAVGEWAKAEAERIKAEAEQRVASRRAQLERQLAAETSHVESGTDALRSRITAYERELEAFHAQLAAINDPAAFAAAATRMPAPPALDGSQPVEPAAVEAEPQAARAEAEPPHAGTNGSAPSTPVADEEGANLPAIDLDTLDATAEAAAANEPETYAEPIATEIVVKGLGSFGSITGFRQQLANVEGIDAVGLSLGTSGEFVFRATHRPSLDMAVAIAALEGDAVEIEPRAEGGIRVTLGRPR